MQVQFFGPARDLGENITNMFFFLLSLSRKFYLDKSEFWYLWFRSLAYVFVQFNEYFRINSVFCIWVNVIGKNILFEKMFTFIKLQSFISRTWKKLDLIHYWLDMFLMLIAFLTCIHSIQLFSELKKYCHGVKYPKMFQNICKGLFLMLRFS